MNAGASSEAFCLPPDGEAPHRSTVCRSLRSSASAVMPARDAVRSLLGGWVDQDLLDDLVLVTSELVTNAVKFGVEGERIWLQIAVSDTEITITVSGHSRGDLAAMSLADAEDGLAESGRGLRIVRDLSDVFTVSRTGLTVMRCTRSRP